ncbi:hypothetical protein [Mucilaginibacter sp.]|uniref:hypothetical protein n=1 Tax=Mucilaginibacter sp. TaxID=1882438 RepID=UPI002631D65E|nr:hypothetical protein [Mucilaginibacter sp.]MDB4920428.1 hypothetical protein [Mucilaginibacter sp.]
MLMITVISMIPTNPSPAWIAASFHGTLSCITEQIYFQEKRKGGVVNDNVRGG